MSATLLFGDCLAIMKTLPDKSVDCFVCDLPYGQLASGQGGPLNPEKYGTARSGMATELCDWDVKIDLAKFWEQVKRLCKDDHTPVIMFCNTKFGYELIKSNESWFRYDLVWNKERGVSFLLANKMPMKSHEMIYVFSKKGAFYNRIDVKTDKPEYKRWGKQTSAQYGVNVIEHTDKVYGKDGTRCALSVITMPNNTSKDCGHPTEKSVDLYKWILSRYCKAEGTVLDPTAGSFNSIQAAKELGLKGIGMEKDRGFFWKAVKRFA
jgi:DNA modification methylase